MAKKMKVASKQPDSGNGRLDGQGHAWPIQSKEVKRVSSLSTEELVQNFIQKETPVIIEQFFSERITQLASPSVLADKHPENNLRVMVNIPNDFLKDFSHDNYKDMSIREFVDFLDSSSLPCYANQQPIQNFPSLEQEITFNTLRPQLKPAFVWFGSSGANIGLHFDAADAYLAQLFGKKKFFLIPHSDSGSVYPFADDITRSVVDLRSFDLQYYPKLRNVVPYVGELQPGDLIFIPKYTWHYFWSVTNSVSVSNFHSIDYGARRLLGLMRMYGLRYSVGVLGQLIWYGILSQHYEKRGYGWDPAGVLLWRQLKRRLAKGMRKVQSQ